MWLKETAERACSEDWRCRLPISWPKFQHDHLGPSDHDNYFRSSNAWALYKNSPSHTFNLFQAHNVREEPCRRPVCAD